MILRKNGGNIVRKFLCAGLVSLLCLGGAPAAQAAAFQVGDQGGEVAEIQEALSNLGYDVTPDGDFGPGTAAAVRSFEAERGLETDGVVGPVVYQALMGRAIPEVSRGGNALARRIAATAMQYLGVPYVYGGSTPDGFDCSGFVRYVFQQAGVPLPRVADDQYMLGTPVAFDNLRTGDLVFFVDDSGELSHVGIYLQDGQFIHASIYTGIDFDSLHRDWRREHYLGARRIV
ncbi:MAG: C40 family peptidase [Selenomonadaceae bacterium]|nr:C40 family peptidase [Selenomonadaceae bacterium]